MIKVLNIISDTNIGGAGRVILNYLRYTHRDRFETWIALPREASSRPRWRRRGAGCWRWTALPTAPTTERT